MDKIKDDTTLANAITILQQQHDEGDNEGNEEDIPYPLSNMQIRKKGGYRNTKTKAVVTYPKLVEKYQIFVKRLSIRSNCVFYNNIASKCNCLHKLRGKEHVQKSIAKHMIDFFSHFCPNRRNSIL